MSLQWGIAVIVMIILTAVSLRIGTKTNSITMMLAAGSALFAGLYAPDALGALGYSTIGVSIGLLLIAYSIFCIAWAYAAVFRGQEKS